MNELTLFGTWSNTAASFCERAADIPFISTARRKGFQQFRATERLLNFLARKICRDLQVPEPTDKK